MAQIKPTLGRVIHFYPRHDEPPLTALIVKVNADESVNLAIFDVLGQPWRSGNTNIPVVQDGEEHPLCGSFCKWMSYQVGQAAKREELQKQLDLKEVEK